MSEDFRRTLHEIADDRPTPAEVEAAMARRQRSRAARRATAGVVAAVLAVAAVVTGASLGLRLTPTPAAAPQSTSSTGYPTGSDGQQPAQISTAETTPAMPLLPPSTQQQTKSPTATPPPPTGEPTAEPSAPVSDPSPGAPPPTSAPALSPTDQPDPPTSQQGPDVATPTTTTMPTDNRQAVCMHTTDVTLANERHDIPDSAHLDATRVVVAGSNPLTINDFRGLCQDSMVRNGWFTDPPPTKACLTADGQVLIYPTDASDPVCARQGIWDVQ